MFCAQINKELYYYLRRKNFIEDINDDEDFDELMLVNRGMPRTIYARANYFESFDQLTIYRRFGNYVVDVNLSRTMKKLVLTIFGSQITKIETKTLQSCWFFQKKNRKICILKRRLFEIIGSFPVILRLIIVRNGEFFKFPIFPSKMVYFPHKQRISSLFISVHRHHSSSGRSLN